MPRSRRAPGNFERRGDSIRWRIDLGKKTHRETFRTTSLREAEDAAKKRYAELERQQERRDRGMLDDERRCSDLFAYYRAKVLPTLTAGTIRSYEDSLKFFEEYFREVLRNPLVRSIRARDIMGYLDWRRVHRAKGKGPGTKDRALSNRTLQKDRAVLRRIFAIADRLEWIDGNPVSRTEVPKSDGRDYVILTDTQYDKLLDECPDEITRLYVLIMGETGARCESEVLWLQWDDIDLDKGFIKIVSGRNDHRTKSGKSRLVPLTPRLVRGIRDHFREYRFARYDGAATPWIFHHTLSRRHHRAGERITSLRRGVMDAAKKAEIPEGWVQHDLRHRRVTTWLAEGKSPVLVMLAMGHSDLRTTMSYMHLVPEHLLALVETPTREELKAGLV